MQSQPPASKLNRFTRRLENHSVYAGIGIVSMVLSLFGSGFACGQAMLPAGPDLVGELYGQVLIDGTLPSESDIGQVEVQISRCGTGGDDRLLVGVDTDGTFEVRDLHVGSTGTTCYRPRIEYRGESAEGEEVLLQPDSTSARIATIDFTARSSSCEGADRRLGIRYASSSQLSRSSQPAAFRAAVREVQALHDEVDRPLSPDVFDETSIEMNDPPTLAQIEEALADCVDVLVTHIGSATAIRIIPEVTKDVIQFSPNATSPELTRVADNGRFFRTAPSDEIQGRVLALDLEAAGKTRAAVFHLDDDYGTSLKDQFEASFEGGSDEQFEGREAGRRVVAVHDFTVSRTVTAEEVDTVLSARPDAVVVIGYDVQTATIVELLSDAGYPSDSLWLVDGNVSVSGELDDPTMLAGARQTVPSYDVGSPAVQYLRGQLEVPDGEPLDGFAGQTYDAVIILALAAAAAEASDDPIDAANVASKVNEVTRDGERCLTYDECLMLIEAGVNVDYDGVGGPYEFVDAGEPFQAYYRIDVYGSDGRPEPQLGSPPTLETLCELCDANALTERIQFETNSAVIGPEYDDALADIADVIRRSELAVVVEGYASVDGAPQDNLDLSRRRAEAVIEHLIAVEGIPAERLTAQGLGPTDRFIENRVVLFREATD